MMTLPLASITVYLLIAALVAILCRRIRIPYTAGLVVAGIGMAALPMTPHIELTHDLIFSVLLPPLLFEGAYDLEWAALRRNLAPVALLATAGVCVAAAVTTAGLHWLLGWPVGPALIFGSLTAATDPVSVIAAFKEARATGRLRVLIEAESLFNDGTAAVLFAVVVSWATGQAQSAVTVGALLVQSSLGGVLCGIAVAALALLIAGRAEDHLVEIAITVVAAYGSFLLADRLGCSGVLATISAGLVLGNLNPRGAITERGRALIKDVWEFAAFLANSMVFLLIGTREAGQNFGARWGWALVAVGLLVASRAATVYPCALLVSWTRWRVGAGHQFALFWGGLRGALALALALSLPAQTPYREPIVGMTFAVVAFSIFAQGLTMTPLLRRLGEIGPSGRDSVT